MFRRYAWACRTSHLFRTSVAASGSWTSVTREFRCREQTTKFSALNPRMELPRPDFWLLKRHLWKIISCGTIEIDQTVWFEGQTQSVLTKLQAPYNEALGTGALGYHGIVSALSPRFVSPSRIKWPRHICDDLMHSGTPHFAWCIANRHIDGRQISLGIVCRCAGLPQTIQSLATRNLAASCKGAPGQSQIVSTWPKSPPIIQQIHRRDPRFKM